MPIPFLAYEISGLATQDYPSGAVNRAFIDALSGSIDSRIDALAGAAEVVFGPYTAANHSVTGFEAGTFAVSSAGGTGLSIQVAGYDTISSNAKKSFTSSQALGDMAFKDSVDISDDTNLTAGTGIGLSDDTLSVVAYDTISSQAKTAYGWYGESSQVLSDAYAWYDASAQKLSEQLSQYVASGDEYSNAWASTQALQDLAFMNESDITEVGTIGTGVWQGTAIEYDYLSGLDTISSNAQKAYASTQSLDTGAFKKVSTGWFYASDQSAIPHGLDGTPNHVTITPSGLVTFSTAFTVDATSIHLRMSAAGQRMVNWRAEV